MLLLAASFLESLQHVSPDTWAKVAIGIAALVVVILIVRAILKMNKLLLGLVLLVAGCILFFSWIYNRNEPKLLTPVVDKIAPFFPSGVTPVKAKPKAPAPRT